MNFSINVDMVRWLRGSNENRRRIIETRKRSAYTIALLIESLAKSNIDRQQINDSRELRDSILAIPLPGGATVIVNAEHGWYVEYGTGIYNKAGAGRKTSWVYKHRDGGYVRTKGREATPYFMSAVVQAGLVSSKILTGVFNSTRRGVS